MQIQLVVYCVIIALASTLGGSLPGMVRLTHRRIQMMLSLVSGVMLGVALFHLLPHAIAVLGNVEQAMAVCLAGLLFMFFLIRMFHFHQHDLAVESEPEQARQTLCDHDHEEDRHHVHCHHHDGSMDLSWAGLCFGLAIHTLIDGIALGAALQGGDHGTGFSTVGIGVFLAIVLHKPLDALSITTLMAARGWTPNQQMVVNVVFALMCPLGAVLFTLGMDQFSVDAQLFKNWILGLALAFSAGIFLCISLGDLLPEVHFHSHDRGPLSAMLLLGIAIAYGIEQLPNHSHEPDSNPAGQVLEADGDPN